MFGVFLFLMLAMLMFVGVFSLLFLVRERRACGHGNDRKSRLQQRKVLSMGRSTGFIV